MYDDYVKSRTNRDVITATVYNENFQALQKAPAVDLNFT